MITVDFKDRRPIYVQLIENIKRLVMTGAMEPDERLPSVRALSVELGINPNTILRAYTELERQGVINTVQGKGVFVSSGLDALMEGKRKEILKRISDDASEARLINIGIDEINSIISAAYAKNGGETDD